MSCGWTGVSEALLALAAGAVFRGSAQELLFTRELHGGGVLPSSQVLHQSLCSRTELSRCP